MLNKWESTHSKNKLESTNCNINYEEDTPPADKCSRSGAGGGVASIVSKVMFERMMPHRNDADCLARGFYTYEAFIAAAGAFPAFGTTGDGDTRRREIAAFLAQTSHETSRLGQPDEPYSWGYYYKQEAGDTGSLPDYCQPSSQYPGAPGKKYYGRGPIQISWNHNYGQAGDAIGVDLLNNPDLVAMDPTVSFKTAIWSWMTAMPPKPSCHAVITGQWRPSGADLAAGRAPGYGVTSNIMSGGLHCSHGPNSNDTNRIGFYKRYCDIVAVSFGENLDSYNQRPFS